MEEKQNKLIRHLGAFAFCEGFFNMFLGLNPKTDLAINALFSLKMLLFWIMGQGLCKHRAWARAMALAVVWPLVLSAGFNCLLLRSVFFVDSSSASVAGFALALDIGFMIWAPLVLLPQKMACRFK